MDINIIVALIEAAGTIIASAIATAGVLVIFKARKNIIDLANNVEAYHKHETRLVKKIFELEDKREATDDLIKHHRGSLRSKLTPQDEDKPSMSADQAKKIRKQYLDFS